MRVTAGLACVLILWAAGCASSPATDPPSEAKPTSPPAVEVSIERSFSGRIGVSTPQRVVVYPASDPKVRAWLSKVGHRLSEKTSIGLELGTSIVVPYPEVLEILFNFQEGELDDQKVISPEDLARLVDAQEVVRLEIVVLEKTRAVAEVSVLSVRNKSWSDPVRVEASRPGDEVYKLAADLAKAVQTRINRAPAFPTHRIQSAAELKEFVASIPRRRIQPTRPAPLSDDPLLKLPPLDFERSQLLVVVREDSMYVGPKIVSVREGSGDLEVRCRFPELGDSTMASAQEGIGAYHAVLVPKNAGKVEFRLEGSGD